MPNAFNEYILKAVADLNQHYPSKGYDINKAYTHDIAYDSGTVKASQPALTMCVAATAEVIITALNLYVKETGDKSVYAYLPVTSWNRMRPKDIRSHIWVDPKLDAYGTADALVTFGIGKRVKFSELEPGSFVNINRLNKSGHSVIFIGFIDSKGDVFLLRAVARRAIQVLLTVTLSLPRITINPSAPRCQLENGETVRLSGQRGKNTSILAICSCHRYGMPLNAIKISMR